jgi:sulfofructose kinase
LDAGGLYAGIERLLPYVDILIPSAEFALGLTQETEIAAAMSALNAKYAPQILVVTDGSNGGYYWENGTAVHYDSVKVKAVDTNGAGDTFHGAFIAAYCEGKNVKDCCVYASKVAAYKCMHTGARTYELSKEIADKL